ncbi:MAG: YIP1 family protein [Algicola sp.]|nr:YIP1 family protein [Algicola sp.]
MTTTATPMTLIDVFVAPQSLFDKLNAAKKYSYLALALLMAVSAGGVFAFFDGMSVDWIVQQQMLHVDASGAEKEAAEQFMRDAAPHTGIIGAVMVVIMLLVTTALYAGYFLLAHKAGGANKKSLAYGDWFSVGVWSQMPMLLSTLGFIALFATAASPDLPISLPNYASLNQLVTGFVPGDALFTWAESLNLFYFWSIALVSIAFQRLSDMSVVKSVTLSIAPYIAVFGLWFVVA